MCSEYIENFEIYLNALAFTGKTVAKFYTNSGFLYTFSLHQGHQK